MIDFFTLALTHGLIVIALWRLLSRPDLDADPLPGPGELPRGADKGEQRARAHRRAGKGRGTDA